MLQQKKGGSIQFFVNYCKVNCITIKDATPLPRKDYSLDALLGTRCFSTLELSPPEAGSCTNFADHPSDSAINGRGIHGLHLGNLPRVIGRHHSLQVHMG